MKQIKIHSRVSQFSGDRKIVEIPASVRDNFEVGEKVNIEKTKEICKMHNCDNKATHIWRGSRVCKRCWDELPNTKMGRNNTQRGKKNV